MQRKLPIVPAKTLSGPRSRPVASAGLKTNKENKPNLSYSMTVPELTGTYEFFVVCTPGLEVVTAAEMRRHWPGLKYEAQTGGLTVRTTLAQGFALNGTLRTATRILLRVAEFGCRDFPKLYKKITAFPWENWLPSGAPVEISASTHSSWLKVKRRIEETCLDGYRTRQKTASESVATAPARKGLALQLIYVRFADDVCTVSLDTSGEILHKRAQRPLSAIAPLRENLAAAVLNLMWQSRGASLEGVSIELVDPMMGGGTFLLEASEMSDVVVSRAFAYQEFVFANRLEIPTSRGEARPFAALLGFERATKAMAAAKENLQALKQASLRAEDFMIAEPLGAVAAGERWLVTNPPYGERLQVSGSLRSFYERLFVACERVATPRLAAFVLPQKAEPATLALPIGWRLLSSTPFLNGGIPVTAVVFNIER